MRYRGYLLPVTQEQKMKIKKLKALIKKETGIDIEKVSRKRETINARKVYYKILRISTNISCNTISKSVDKTHATVLHALKNFEWDYKTDKAFREMYDNIYSIYIEGREITSSDDIVEQNSEMQNIIHQLKEEVQQLRNELKEARSNKIRPRNQQTKIYNASETIVAF